MPNTDASARADTIRATMNQRNKFVSPDFLVKHLIVFIFDFEILFLPILFRCVDV